MFTTFFAFHNTGTLEACTERQQKLETILDGNISQEETSSKKIKGNVS